MPAPDHIALSPQAHWRRFLILLLLVVTLFSQSAALGAEYQQHHSTEHCCLLCHVSMPFLQASAQDTIAPLTSLQWLAPDSEFDSFYDVFLATSSSRGPPAHS